MADKVDQDEDDDADFAADEAARISALQKMAPDVIWLQVDPEGDACSSEWSLLDGATWCSDKINSTDVAYIRADKHAELDVKLATEKERADYAWRNANTIDKARQEEMAKRDALEATIVALLGIMFPLKQDLSGDDERTVLLAMYQVGILTDPTKAVETIKAIST